MSKPQLRRLRKQASRAAKRRTKRSRARITRRPLTFEQLEDRRVLAPLAVTSTLDAPDANPGDGIVDDGAGNATLRAAIMEANALVGPDTINIAAGTYTLSLGGTLEDAAFTGDLDITDDLTISGAGAAATIIDATGLGDRVFHIPFSGIPKTVSIMDVTITGGTATDAGFGFLSGSAGGGILNEDFGSAITLADSVVTENTALGAAFTDGLGGGIADLAGNWTIINTEITDNDALGGDSAAGRGGAFYSDSIVLGPATTTLLVDSTISGNEAIGGADTLGVGLSGVGEGGGIYNDGGSWSAIGSTTIDGNVAKGGAGFVGSFAAGGTAFGGGIYDRSGMWTFTLIPGSTISRNQAIGGDGDDGGEARGGGIYGSEGSFTFQNNTISNNLAVGGNVVGGGVFGGAATGGGIYAENFATIDFDYVTIAENDATGGTGTIAGTGAAGGVFSDDLLTAMILLHSTIIATNTASSANPDVGDALGTGTGFMSMGFNLIGNADTTPFVPAAGDLVGSTGSPIAPLLGPLMPNGGPTETHLPMSGSPAIDAADPVLFPPFDQRGMMRPVDGDAIPGAISDIGSVEVAAPMGAASIDIEKFTNSIDADTPTGPLVPAGGPVTFTYTVANTGGVDLSSVVVTDSVLGVIPGPTSGDFGVPGVLEVGEIWTYVFGGTAATGQYMNTGSVTALDPTLAPVMDMDDSHHFGVVLDIDIEKFTDGVDADSPTGPEILVGGTAIFTYEVTTGTGNVALDNVVVTDDNGTPGLPGDDFNPAPVLDVTLTYNMGDTNTDGLLDPGETWLYSATRPVTACQFVNEAEAEGDDATNTVVGTVTDTDFSHHFGAVPQIELEKLVSVDGPGGPFVPADSAPGPMAFSTGPAPEFKFEVTLGTGTGAVPLSNVVVSDPSLGGIISGPTGGDDGDLILEAGETWVYFATGTFMAGQQTNTGSANGDFTDSQSNTGAAPTATDDANYFGAVVSIDIEKLTVVPPSLIGVDDAVAAPGDPITFTYDVTNPGNVPLDNAVVVDDNGTPGFTGDDFNPDPVLDVTLTYNIGDTNTDGLLDPGETWEYEHNTTALDLGVSIDFETDDQGSPLAPGTVIDDEYEDFGLTVSGGAEIFDSSSPLVSLLNFNEISGPTAADTSGQGNNNFGTLDPAVGAPVWTGGTLDFDGVDDRVLMAASSDINLFDVAQRSIYVRFKADNAAGGKQVLYEEGSLQRGLNIYIDSGQLYVGGWNLPGGVESGWSGTYLNTAITSGVWYEVELVLDGGLTVGPNAIKGYLDGNLFGSGSGSQVWAHSGAIGIGATNVQTIFHDGNSLVDTHHFDGEIDELRISNPDLGTPNEDFGGPGIGAGGAAGALGENRNAQDNVLFLDGGGTITFDFANPVRVNNIGLLDIDSAGATIDLFDSGATLISSTAIPNLGDNSFQILVFNTVGVSQMKVNVPGETFAVTSLDYDLTFVNEATASGDFNPTAVASDESSYTNPLQVSIDIEKTTQGLDADSATGAVLLTMTQADFEYFVTNTGQVPLGPPPIPMQTTIFVSDDNGTPGDTMDDFNAVPVNTMAGFNVGDLNMNTFIDLNEQWQWTASRAVTAGQFTNVGSVSAADPLQQMTVTASDPSNHFGADPQIDIEKRTLDGTTTAGTVASDFATSATDGANILVGESVTWIYQVTSVGNVDLSSVSVTDDQGVSVSLLTGDDGDNVLEDGEVWYYTATGMAVAGPYSNIGTATGDFTDDDSNFRQVNETDDSAYFGADPQIAIEKRTFDGTSTAATVVANFAAAGDGNNILVGEDVTWIYQVSLDAAGNVDLSNIVVSDSETGVTPTYLTGDVGVIGVLESGETWYYADAGTAVAGTYTNTGTASGSFTDSAGDVGTDTETDASSYFGADPQIAIEKRTLDGTTTAGSVAGDFATAGDGINIVVGEAVTWIYQVKLDAAGNVNLSNIVVSDSETGVTPTYLTGDVGVIGVLESGETWYYTDAGIAIAGDYTNIGTASGSFTDSAGHTGTDTETDPSSYFGEQLVGGEGCTPGFWKTHSRYGPAPEAGWGDTVYDPDQLVDDVFVTSQFGTTTLLEAMQTGGGGVNALMRHAVAALLNASNPNVSYDLTVAQVIQMTNDALAPGGDVEGTKDVFAEFNEQGCDLSPGGGGDPGVPNGATVQGIVWVDENGNGAVDQGEQAIQNVTISLTGFDLQGNLVALSEVTDGDGVFQFDDLPASDSSGYTITEVQPAGFDNDREYAGSINGVPVSDDANVFDDEFTVVLALGDLAENFNFAEQIGDQTGVYLEAGTTATNGFWQNKNGQNLIKSLNGGANDTQLGNWLANSFPELYGATSTDPVDGLAGQTNAEVAAYFKQIFKTKKKNNASGPAKLDPQAMAVALSVYVTDRGLAGGTTAESYGFATYDPIIGNPGMAGTGGSFIDIDAAVGAGSAELLFGVGTPSVMTVMDILTLTNENSSDGVLFEDPDDGDDQIDMFEQILRSLANDLFSAINENGDI